MRTTRKTWLKSSKTIAFLLCAAFAWSCGGDVDASKEDAGGLDAGGDAEVRCVLAEGECPASCVELDGSPVDAERGCTLEREVIGCAKEGSGFPDEIGCYVELESETVYWTPQLYRDLPGFRKCAEGERNWEHEKRCQDPSSDSCELRADGSCADGCMALDARPLDEEQDCLGASETIGCAANGATFPGAIGCQVDLERGIVFVTGSLYPTLPGYRQCTEDERAASITQPLCQ